MSGADEKSNSNMQARAKGAEDRPDDGLHIALAVNRDLQELKAELARISTFNAPGTMATMPQVRRLTGDKLAAQAESLGTLTYEALSDFCLQSTGDEFSQRQYSESVGLGVDAFCRSIAMQIRGSFGPDLGDGDE